ncbi:phage major capsid protein [Prochlorococcus sp. MIT 1307]|uniref:phage major capsid protein n=1 Tax=Prochlorococcus sp. MIT 1307 TaxID=3096219 RepID=UPI002A75D54E|nr:phage major capsid protein [Prochlorococcus sp. MIT 1307]
MTTDTAIKTRFLDLDSKAADSDTFNLSFSSENPVPTPLGDEVLSHKREAVDLSRLNDGAPFLWNHQPNEVLGVVESAEIVNEKGRATVRWGTSDEAIAKRKEVTQGILQNISVGYQINESEYTDDGKTLVTRWQPVEISLVAVPSDNSIGIHRSHPSYSEPMTASIPKEVETISNDWQSAEYRDATRDFSMVRAIQASVSGDWSQAGLEREVNQELQLQTGKRSQGFLVPNNAWSKRAYVTSSASAGGYAVATEHLADQFVESLRPSSAVVELGARMLPGLVGNVDIPARNASSTTYWIGADDADSVTESTGTLRNISMQPKTIGAYSKYSHLMSLQSTPEIEELIKSDIIAKIAEGIDVAAINGSGSSSQPLGILNTTGIGSVAGGTNGAAADLDDFVDLKKAVSVDNADLENCAFLTNAKVEGAVHKLKDSNGDYILSPYGAELGKQQILSRRFHVSNNVPSDLTKGSGSGLSAILYGNFKDLLIGMWGSLEVLVDPYTDIAKGTVGIRALQSIDIAVRHAESFAAMKDAIAS